MESDKQSVDEKNKSVTDTPEDDTSLAQTSQVSEKESPQSTSNKPPRKSKNKKIMLIVALMVVVVLLMCIAAYFLLQKSDSSNNNSTDASNNSTDTSQAETINEANENGPTKRIYFAESTGEENQAVLYSVEPTTKELRTVESGIVSGSGISGVGSDTPLNAPDFLKVAYIKDEAVWITGENLEPGKIAQPEITSLSDNSNYRHYLSAWSSDSEHLVFVIDFSCPIHSADCSQSDENQEVAGIYLHTLSTNETVKLPIDRVEQWIPGTMKIVYYEPGSIDNSSQMRAYDVENGTDEQLSVAPFGFGVQAAFSDDGNRLIYSQGVNGTQASEVIAADVDNSNQSLLLSGSWGERQWPMYLSGSDKDYVYTNHVSELCADGGLCTRIQLMFMVDGKVVPAGDIREGPIGNFGDYVVVLTGSSRSAPYEEPKVISINLENQNTRRTESSIFSKTFEGASGQNIMLNIGH